MAWSWPPMSPTAPARPIWPGYVTCMAASPSSPNRWKCRAHPCSSRTMRMECVPPFVTWSRIMDTNGLPSCAASGDRSTPSSAFRLTRMSFRHMTCALTRISWWMETLRWRVEERQFAYCWRIAPFVSRRSLRRMTAWHSARWKPCSSAACASQTMWQSPVLTICARPRQSASRWPRSASPFTQPANRRSKLSSAVSMARPPRRPWSRLRSCSSAGRAAACLKTSARPRWRRAMSPGPESWKISAKLHCGLCSTRPASPNRTPPCLSSKIRSAAPGMHFF